MGWRSSGGPTHTHRLSSWVVLGLAIWVYWRAGKQRMWPVKASMALVLGQMAVGLGLAYAGLPQPLQVLHLGLAALLICARFLPDAWESGRRA